MRRLGRGATHLLARLMRARSPKATRWLRWLTGALAGAAVAAFPVAVANATQLKPAVTITPSTNGTYSFGSLTAPQITSQQFTVANTGGSATSALFVALVGSPTFSVTADSCSAISLGPRKSCYVTVQYAATTDGQNETATLWATSNKAPAYASVTLDGHSNATFTLTVQKLGGGAGDVVSAPSGISCGDNCSTTYPYGAHVTLSAQADDASTFAGWSGACSGVGACSIVVTGPTIVGAIFDPQ